MIDRTQLIYAKNEIELPWSIKPSPVYDENQIDNDVTDLIDLVYIEIETKLSGPIWLSVVCD